jgi:hypothetical protein
MRKHWATFAFFACATAAAQSSAPVGARPAASDPSGEGALVFRGVTGWSFRGDQLRGQGTATTLVYDRGQGVGHATTVDATVAPERPGDGPARLQSAEVRGKPGAQEAWGSGGVVVSRADGEARTASAHYDGPQHHLEGQEPVDALTDRFTVHGSAFTLQTQTQVLDIVGPVAAHQRRSP